LSLVLPTQKTEIVRSLEDSIILIHGRAKMGKSTLASQFPDWIFFATEPGLGGLSTYPLVINSWVTFLEACALIAAGDHKFQGIIIDTIDKLIVYCTDFILAQNNIRHPSDIPHGKGWNMITTELDRAMTKLNNLPYGMMYLSHSVLIEVETPTKKYSRWTIRPSGKNRDVFLDAATLIMYLDSAVDAGGEEKRLLRTEQSLYYDAGDRFDVLPPTIPFEKGVNTYELIKSYFNEGKEE
jgi:hypothetical protein